MTKMWSSGNPSSRSQTPFPRARSNSCYGSYKRRHENFTDAQKLGVAARTSSRKRKLVITLPQAPFDWKGEDQ